MTRISPENIEQHIRTLTQDIGVRLAGSAQEKEAADYVADQFKQTGAEVRIEQVSVQERAIQEERLEVWVADTNSDGFKKSLKDRRNRNHKFFHHKPPRVLDICQVPVPARLEKGPVSRSPED